MTSIHQTPVSGPGIVKHRVEDLPDLPPRPKCVKCGSEAPDVTLTPHGTDFAHLCRPCRQPTPEKLHAELVDMWVGLAEDLYHGRLGEWEVYAYLVERRPDLSPPRRWALFEALECEVTFRRDVQDGMVRPADLEMTQEELDADAEVRVRDAANALIGGAR